MKNLRAEVSAKDHIRGSESAGVTLVEYGDFQCPDAGAAYPMVKRVQKHFGQKLRFVFRNFPLREIHPLAEPAARLAEFAAASDKYWEMHDALYENQDQLGGGLFLNLAEGLGLDGEGAAAALKRVSEKVEDDVAGGKRSGVHGTPTFFINGQLYEGEWVYEDLAAAIEDALAAGR